MKFIKARLARLLLIALGAALAASGQAQTGSAPEITFIVFQVKFALTTSQSPGASVSKTLMET
jgi:hypothetical protein